MGSFFSSVLLELLELLLELLELLLELLELLELLLEDCDDGVSSFLPPQAANETIIVAASNKATNFLFISFFPPYEIEFNMN